MKSVEFIDEPVKKKKAPKRRNGFKEVLDGSILKSDMIVQQVPFIIYLTILAIVYIGNRYHAERIIRESLSLQAEVKELKAEAISTSSELLRISKQSEVIKLVVANGLELEEAVLPPKKIVMINQK